MTKAKAKTARRATAPDIAVFGYGSPDALHLTAEAQRMLEGAGRVFSIGVPPGLERLLKQLRVKFVDLGEHLDQGRPYAHAYLDMVDEVLGRATIERPVILLTPGSPMFLDSVTRFLVVEGRKRDLRVDVHAGVSPLDVLVSYLGVDVAAFGIQVFSAAGLVKRRIPASVTVPLVALELAGIEARIVGGNGDSAGYAVLARHLADFYPADHPVTMVNLTAVPGRRSHATRPLARFSEFLPHIAMNSHLFIDAVTNASREEK